MIAIYTYRLNTWSLYRISFSFIISLILAEKVVNIVEEVNISSKIKINRNTC
jgi:hypothetical protein